jgi:putative transposase
MDYRYGSHTVYKIQYHFVFVTKYRYKVLKGDVGLKVRELIRQTCEAFEIEIIKGVVSQDHDAHFCLCAAEHCTERDNEANQRKVFDEAV